MLRKQFNNKKIALVICFFIIATTILGIEFIISHYNHDCIGNNCLVCHQIQNIEKVLKQISLGFRSLITIKVIINLFLFSMLVFMQLDQADITLVSLKVRLDN